jgi:hypothetical protein
MFGNVIGIARWLGFGPGIRIKMRSLSEAIQAEPANARLAAHSVSG